MKNIAKKHRVTTKLWGVTSFTLGVSAAVAALLFNYELYVRRIPVGKVGLVIVGLVFIATGIFMLLTRDQVCVACNEELEEEKAYFPLSARTEVLQAYQTAHADPLFQLEIAAEEASEKIELGLSWCDNCQKAGLLSLAGLEGNGDLANGGEKELEGNAVSNFLGLVKRHLAKRG